MKTKRVKAYYVSGPMRGIPLYNFPAFDSLSAWIRKQGLIAINPADHDREVEPDVESQEHYLHGDPSLKTGDRPDFHQLIGWDLRMLASPECDGIVLMPGWENSVGAQHERYVAEATGKEVWRAYPDAAIGEWHMTMDDDRTLSAKRNDPLRYKSPRDKRLEMQKEEFRRDIAHIRQGSPFTTTKVEITPYARPTTPDELTIEHGEVRVRNEKTGGEKGTKLARFELLPARPLQLLAEHYGRGSQKYEDRNWERGYDWSLSFGAMMRHAWAFWGGEDLDPETGSPHIIAVAWHALAMAEFMQTHPELDNRPGRSVGENG